MKQANKDHIWNRCSVFVLALLTMAEGLLLFQILRLNMLPGGYVAAIAGVLAVVTLLLALLLFRRKAGKWQKAAGYGKQIAGYILCAVLIIGCFTGSSMISKVADTISTITAPSTSSVVLEVYVRQEDPAQYIQDAADYTFGISLSTSADANRAALTELHTLLGKQPELREYESPTELIDALLSGEADAIILDSAYVSVVEDLDGYEDFSDLVRILHEHVVENVPQSTEATEKDYLVVPDVKNPERTSFLLYISGNDARLKQLADGGSDVNILVAVNPTTHQVLLVNTPRDYYVENPAGNGARDKLSHCGLGGINNCIGAMTGLYDLPINYYARINFSGFRTLVDAMGGVTIYAEKGFSTRNYYIYQGENHLNGAQALDFARERKSLPGGDNDRGKNQMKLITAMIDQLSTSNLLENYEAILQSLEGMFSTSMPAQTIGKLVQLQLTEMPQWEIHSFAVTGDNGNDRCWAVGNGYGYVMYPHMDEVEYAAELIQRVLDGETLTDEDLEFKS